MQTPPPIRTREKDAGQKQVQVLFDFTAQGHGELSIRKGDVIDVIAEIDQGKSIQI